MLLAAKTSVMRRVGGLFWFGQQGQEAQDLLEVEFFKDAQFYGFPGFPVSSCTSDMTLISLTNPTYAPLDAARDVVDLAHRQQRMGATQIVRHGIIGAGVAAENRAKPASLALPITS